MLPNKILFTLDETLAHKLALNFWLQKESTSSWLQIYSWNYKQNNIILCLSWKEKEEIIASLTYIYDNYNFVKFINLWEVNFFNENEYKQWDVIIPNTFISDDNVEPIFIANMPWGNYDLENFWVIFNGICISSFEKESGEILLEQSADLLDIESYLILSFFWKEEDFEEKFLIIKLCWDFNYYDNLIDILEMIL